MPAPGDGEYPWPGGKIATKALRETIEDVLHSDAATAIHLSTSRQDHGNHAFAIDDNGSPRALHEGRTYPYRAVGLTRYPVPAGKSIDAWLALVRELASIVEAGHGVTGASPRSPGQRGASDQQAWATFLRSAHFEAVWGRNKLLTAVNPPVVHDVGDLLYIQLSASIDVRDYRGVSMSAAASNAPPPASPPPLSARSHGMTICVAR